MHDLVYARHAEMHALYVFGSGHAGLEFLDIVEIQQTFFKHLILRVQQAFFALWMRRRDRVVECREKYQPCVFLHDVFLQTCWCLLFALLLILHA